VTLPADWAAVVNAPHTEEEIAAVRNCVNRQCPFGSPDWVAQKAVELGLEQTIAPLGRPRRPR
jgi:putative transposase